MLDWFIELARVNGFLAFIMICAVYYAVKLLLRTIKVAIRGWPPAHLDADGDFKPVNKG